MKHDAAAVLSRFHRGRLAAVSLLVVAVMAVAIMIWVRSPLAGAEVADAKAQPPAHPTRIVSINPCVDALLMQLADSDQIAAISHYSHDKEASSASLEWALQFPATSGTAEEILAMRPDLVVASSHVAIPTERALERLGIPLVKLIIPQSVAESRQQITDLAHIIDQQDRGEQLNQNIGDAFERAKPADDEKIPALIWRRGGLVPGEGTLPDELLRWTGFANVSKDYGLAQWDVLTLEHLVNRPPHLLFSDGVRIGSDGQPVMPHPVLEKLSDRITIARYPERLLHCAGPTLIDAVTILSAERRKYKGAL